MNRKIQIKKSNKSKQIKQFQIQNKSLQQSSKSIVYDLFNIQDVVLNQNETHLIIVKIIQYFIIIQNIFWSEKLKQNSHLQQAFVLSLIFAFLKDYKICFYLLLVILYCYLISVLVYFEKNKSYQITDNIATRKKILQYFSLIVELSFALSMILFFVSPFQSSFFVCLAIVFQMLDAVYFSNYLIRKQSNYLFSFQVNFQFKLIVILWNLSLGISNANKSMFLFVISSSISCFVYVIWFILKGYKLHSNKKIQMANIFFTSLSISSSYQIANNYILDYSIFTNNIYAQFLIIFLVSFASLYMMIRNKQTRNNLFIFNSDSSVQLKEAEIILMNQIKINDNEDVNVFSIGLVGLHRELGCSNVDCFSNKKYLYDPLIKEIKNNDKNARGMNQICFKFYIKCLYKQKITKLIQNKSQLILNYCQFLVNQFQDSVQIMKQIYSLDEQYLKFSQRIKIMKIKRIVNNYLLLHSKVVYDQHLIFEKVLKSEKNYLNVLNKILYYTQINMQIWDRVKSDNIELSYLQRQVRTNNKILKEINQTWKQVEQLLYSNNMWKSAYLSYVYLIKNQTIKNKDKKQMFNNNQQDQSCSFIDNQIKISKSHLTDNNSIIFTAQQSNHILVFTKVNNNFQKILKYTQSQIKMNSINIIIEDKVKQTHDKLFNQFIGDVKYVDQKNFVIQKTYVKSKYQHQYQVYKYFKILLDLNEDKLKYFCFLKVCNINEPTTIGQQSLSKDQVINSIDIKSKKQTLIHNILLKQQQYTPTKQIKNIYYIKIVVRLFFILSVILALFIFFNTNIYANQLSTFSTSYIQFVNNLKYPYSIGIQQMLYITNLTAREQLLNATQQSVIQFQNNSASPSVRMTIFNPNLNNKHMYTPFVGQQNASTYDEYQIYYAVLSLATSLRNLDFDKDNKTFFNFRNFLNPGVLSFFQSIKMNYHLQFQKQFQQIKYIQYLEILLQNILTIVALILIVYLVFCHFQNVFEIIQTIFRFDKKLTKNIRRYWKSINQMYFKLVKKQIKVVQQSNQKSQNTNLIYQQIENKVNKNSRQSSIKSQLAKYKIFYIFIFLCYFMIVNLCLSIGNMNIIKQIQKKSNFQLLGFQFLKSYPFVRIGLYSVLQKYYHQTYPNDILYNTNKYNDSLNVLKVYGERAYEGSKQSFSSQFQSKYKAYYYDNICLKSMALLTQLNYNLQYCTSALDGSFNQGLSAVTRRIHQRLYTIIYEEQHIDKQQLIQITKFANVFSIYNNDLIMTWNSQFTKSISQLQSLQRQIVIIQFFVMIILQVFIFEILMRRYMKRQYEVFRTVFEIMVPQQLLQKDKVVRQKFIKQNILIRY